MYKFFNTFSLVSYYALYHKYSEIVYEGNELSIFGVLTFNNFTETWEFEKSLAFLNTAKSDLIEMYQQEKIWNIVDSVFQGCVLVTSALVLGYCAKKIY